MYKGHNTLKIFLVLFLLMAKVGTMFAYSTGLVNVKDVIPTILLDIRYATTNNFTNQVIYKSAQCYLRPDVAQALLNVQNELQPMGYGLKIWDAYRPLSAQWKLWNIVPDERYVSDPRKGGRHTRATAVDVTLISLEDGSELEMPTEFDDFTEKAWRTYEGSDVSDQARTNMKFLESVMEKQGFKGLETEWWHFDYQNWQEYDVLDIEI